MIDLINNIITRIRRRSEKENGMTLVEVVVAFFIIAIISTVLIRGTITAVNTVRINKSKTEALAVANEKMEILKSLDYDSVLINYGEGSSGNEGWTDSYTHLDNDVFNINYYISWAYGEVGASKHIKVSVSGDELNVPVEVVTQLYPPAGEEATGGNIYPPAEDLVVQSDEIVEGSREVVLTWTAPDTERPIIRYNVYRDDILIASALTVYYSDTLPDSNMYTYHITVTYEGSIESVPSNSISTGTPFSYPEPVNFIITGYTYGDDSERVVQLAWEAPITELVLIGYAVYRDDVEVGTTTFDVLTFENLIGELNYTFYVTALYEGDEFGYNESGPSNVQTTE
jgi:type II secretory pathway pseudopilin PulG